MNALATLVLQAGEEAVPETEVLVVSVVITLLIAVGVGYWIYRDASDRENNELLWALGTGFLLFMALPLGAIAAVAYLLLRTDETAAEPGDEEWGDSDDGWETADADRDGEADEEWGSATEGGPTDDWDAATDDGDDDRDW